MKRRPDARKTLGLTSSPARRYRQLMRRAMPIIAMALVANLSLGGCSQESNRDVTAVRAVAATEAARTFRIDGESKSWDTSDPKSSTSSSHTTGEVDRAQQSTHMVSKTRSSDPSDG